MDPLNLMRVGSQPLAADSPRVTKNAANGADGAAFDAELDAVSGEASGEKSTDGTSSPENSQVLLSQASKKAKRQAELSALAAVQGAHVPQTPAMPTQPGSMTPVFKGGAGMDKNARVMDTIAERVPETQFAAVSLRAGDQMMEANPWSRDWVFHSDDAQNTQLKSLLGQPEDKNPAAGPGRGKIELKPGLQKIQVSEGSEVNLAELEKLLELQAQVQSQAQSQGPAPVKTSGSNQEQLAAVQARAQLQGRAPTAADRALMAAETAPQVRGKATLAPQQAQGMSPADAELAQMLERLDGILEMDDEAPVSSRSALMGSGAIPISKDSKSVRSNGVELKGSPVNRGMGGSDFLDMRQAVTAASTQGGMSRQQNSGGFSSSQDGEAGSGFGASSGGRLQNLKGASNAISNLSPEPFSGPVQTFVARPHDGIAPALISSGAAVPVMTGQTTQGAAMKDRLASESLKQISEQIGTVSAKGPGMQNGEMRIRLKPDDLGEVHLRVNTNGNQVGLQVQASNDRAKKIIEESLVHLKDSLAHQNLVLAKADIGVGLMNQNFMGGSHERGGQSQMGSDFSQQGNPNANAYAMAQDGATGRGFSDGRRSAASGDEGELSSSGAGRSRARASEALGSASMAARNQGSLGRIDITA